MLTSLISIAHGCSLNAWAFGRCVDDFSTADWLVHDSHGHSARWIAGHIAVHRHQALELMGLSQERLDWADSFRRGSSSDGVPSGLDGGAIQAAFHAAHQAMTPAWEALTDAHVLRPLGKVLPDGGDTVLAGLRFLAWHESYHIGQLGMLRRLAGKPAIV
jgi:uncharacterized damage-inducible protein DinB